MAVTAKESPQSSTRWQRWVASAWVTLRSPKLTGLLLAVIAVVVLVGLLLPQATPPADASFWIGSLPQVVQLWGEPLYLLGFARIFQSIWFWLPVGLLLLNSLVALADYTPGSWRRLKQRVPSLAWQHPLARRNEQIVRLPKSPDIYLISLQTSLAEQGFYLYQVPESEGRLVGAARRRWAWLGLVATYAGLGLLVAALLVSHYFLQLDRFTLWPQQPVTSRLFPGQFELAGFAKGQGAAQVLFSPGGSSTPTLLFNFYRYQPVLSNYVLLLPTGTEPVLTIEARTESGELLRLIPIQEDLSPADRLNLPLTGRGEPLYFAIPAAKLAVQILPDLDSGRNSYQLQIRRGSDEVPPDTLTVQAGQTFALDDLSVTLTANRNLSLLAYRDPTLPLYLIGGLLILGGLATLLPFLAPWQLWLVPEIKGLGGQLYGVVEKYGGGAGVAAYLEQLLAMAVPIQSSSEPPPEADLENSADAKPSI